MKKSIFAIFLALAITLTACNNGGTEEQTDSQSTPQESSQSETSPTEESSDSTSPSDDPTDTSSQTEQSAEPAPPPEDCDFLFPDGTAGYFSDGTKTENGYSVQYDFSFMRFANPFYLDTDTTPELYDFENYEFNSDLIAPQLDRTCTRVKKGDTIGAFTVKDAHYLMMLPQPEYDIPDSLMLMECYVELEGSITVEGILYCAVEDEYGMAQGDVVFYPNPATCENVPLAYDASTESDNMPVERLTDLAGEKAYVMDSCMFEVGNVYDIGIESYFENSQYAKAKLTLKDISVSYNNQFGSKGTATVADIERLS